MNQLTLTKGIAPIKLDIKTPFKEAKEAKELSQYLKSFVDDLLEIVD
jgi:hypothetical protein